MRNITRDTAPRRHLRLSHALLAPLLTVSLAACGGDPGEGASIAPRSVTASDLEGYWYHEETSTVLAFQTAEDAFWDTFTWIDDLFGEPISTAWFLTTIPSGGAGIPDVRQAATWSVGGGHIDQTVLAESSGLAGDRGTKYRTDIKKFRARHSMTLESGKTFNYGASCADFVRPGRFFFRATVDYGSEGNLACSGTYFVGYVGLGVDPEGGVHSVTTIADNNLSLLGSSLYPCAPLAASWDGGCDARRWPTEYSDGEALTIDPTTMTIHSVHSVDVPGEPGKILYRIRPIGAAADVEPFTVVDPLTGSTQVRMLVFARGDTGRVVVGNTIYERDGQAFTAVTPTLPGAGAPTLAAGAFGPDGRLYTMSAQHLYIESATEPGTFDTVALPRPSRDNGLGVGMAVGPDGDVHVTYPYDIVSSGGFVSGSHGVYARYDGAAWHEIEMGLLGRSKVAVTEAGEPILLHALVKGADVSYYLSRVRANDTLDSWRVLFGVTETGTLEPWTNPALAVGGGRVAYTTQGITVGVADLEALFDPERERPTAPLTLTFEGTGHGRVVSDDGRVDCAETCTVDVPIDRYLRLTTTPADGSIALAGPGTPIGGDDGVSLRTGFVVTSEAAAQTVRFDLSITGRIIDAAALSLGEEVIAMATDDARVAMLVRSLDETFHYGEATLTAPATSTSGVYLLTGDLGGPARLRAVDLDLDVAPTLARLAPGHDLELTWLVTNARKIGGVAVGTDSKSTIVRATVTAEGAVGAPKTLLPLLGPAYATGAAGDATGVQAIFVETGGSLTEEGTTRRAFVVIDGEGATLHRFDDESVGGVAATTLGPNLVDASGGAVLAAADGLLRYVVDGVKRWEIATGDVIYGVDASSPSPAIITLRARADGGMGANAWVTKRDPTTGAVSDTIDLGLGYGAIVAFDARPEAGYWLSSFGAFRSPVANAVSIRFFDGGILEFQWEGGFNIKRVTRTSGGRTWLQLTLTAPGHTETSVQGHGIPDRRAFLVEMRPASALIAK